MTAIERPDGRLVSIEDGTYKVIGKVAGRAFMLLEGEDEERFEYPIEEFRSLVSAGRVHHATETLQQSSPLTRSEFEEQAFRKEVLRQFQIYRQDGLKNEAAAGCVKKQLLNSARYHVRAANFPCVRTIQIWIKMQRQGGEEALNGRRNKMGNRTFRHDLLFEDTVLDLLEDTYLTSDRYIIKTLHETAANLYLKKCREIGIKPKDHGRRCVESIIARLPHRDVVKLRLDDDTAKSRNRSSARHFNLKQPFDRIEIDSTWADCFVIVGKEKVEIRLFITIAVDCATGWLVGMTVSDTPPTNLTTVETLLQAMTETDDAFFDRFEIENRFQAYGSLMVIVSDQGGENSGDYIRQLLWMTTAEFQLGRPKKPEARPFVESAHGVMKKFIIQLPGATQTKDMPAQKRTDVAMKEACLTAEEFEKRLQRWRYDVYAVTPRRRIQNIIRIRESPMAAWRRLEAEVYIPEPPTKAELEQLLFCKRERRKTWHHGIEYERIQYWSQALNDLRLDKKVMEIEIAINPMDIRSVLAIDPFTKKSIVVPSKDPEMPAISFEELKRIRENLGMETSAPMRAAEINAELIKGTHHQNRKGATKRKELVNRARAERRDREISKRSTQGSLAETMGQSAPDLPVPAGRTKSVTKIRKKPQR